MQTVKARKQGNATVVTIPTSIKVPVDTEFYVIMQDDGSITFIPRIKNYYETPLAAPEELWQDGELDNDDLHGREAI